MKTEKYLFCGCNGITIEGSGEGQERGRRGAPRKSGIKGAPHSPFLDHYEAS